MMTSNKASDAALAHKMRESMRAAGDYARRLKERGYDIRVRVETGDDDGPDIVASVIKHQTVEL